MTAIAVVAANDLEQAAIILRRDGAVVLKDVWTAQQVDHARAVVDTQHPEFNDPDRLTDYLGDKHERFIAPVRLTQAIDETGLLRTAAIEALCTAALGAEYEYEAFGVLMARAGARPQEPHRDGGVLFPDAAIDRVLPASAITIAVPLVDVDSDHAPTGLAVGSHRLEPGSSHAPLAAVSTLRGSAVIWDFRTLHAGLANRTDRARPALYFTACRPFWTDHGNFRFTATARLVGDAATIAALGPRYIRARAG